MPSQTDTALQPPRQNSRVVHLARGQTMRIWLPAACTVVAQNGALALTEPLHWLDNQPLGTRVPLADGQAHQLERAGWVELEATTRIDVLCLWEVRAPWPVRLWQRLAAGRVNNHPTPVQRAGRAPGG